MENSNWHCIDVDDNDLGPTNVDNIKSQWANGKVNGDSFVWHAVECEAWTALDQFPRLLALVKPAPPPPAAASVPPQLPPRIAPRPSAQHHPHNVINRPNVQAAATASAQRRSMKQQQQQQAPRPHQAQQQHHIQTASTHAPSADVPFKHASRKPLRGGGGGGGGRIRLNGQVVGDWMILKTADGVPYYLNQTTNALSWDKPDAMKDASELVADKGNWVWFPDEIQGYVPATLVRTRPDGRSEVTLQDGGHAVSKRGGKVFPLSRSSLERLERDLVLLDSLDEGLILFNLRERFMKHQQIYTNIGTILISINPYETHPIYSTELIWEYRNRGNRLLDPHVYQVADEALVPLLEYGENHSILISGDSGSGKTWNTKQCLSYLTEVTSKGESGIEGIEAKILAANPILEAFGNAKTVRNDNSSRFGRFTEVHFENTGKIRGSRIDHFLLEKSRVVWQQAEERNYHIFYFLLSSTWRDSYGLHSPEDYHFLSQSGCYTVDDVDDAHEFEVLLQAFSDLGFSQEETIWVFELIATVLQIGNIQFVSEEAEGGQEGSKLSPAAHVSMQYITQLLHVDEAALHHALTHRSIEVRGTVTHIPLKPALAQDSRNALAKSIYGQLFDWLVSRINSSLMGAAKPWALIGLLDIFGFEIFDKNSFEQLAINFCNERLQQIFNRDTFKKEEDMYTSEGIQFKHIQYTDNQPILDMIERSPGGLLLTLDDMNRMPRSTDEGFVRKADEAHKANPFYITSTLTRQGSKSFTVKHYAGDVVYDAEGFLVKNKDLLYADLYEVMSNSTKPETAAMFPPMTKSSRSKFSLGGQFRQQLSRLMKVLNATQTHYIRCIKPNTSKSARQIESTLVLDQLRYSGVFEAVRIRKQGFPFRYTYERFVERYKCLMYEDGVLVPQQASDARGKAKEILAYTQQTSLSNEIRFGRTMALYRAEQHRLLELMRSLALERICGVIQALVRGVIARKFVRKCLAVKPKLMQAIASRELTDLNEALVEYARIVGQYAGMVPADIGVVRKAKSLKHALVEWEEVCVALNDLVRRDVRNDDAVFEGIAALVFRGDDLANEPGTEWHMQMYEYSRKLFIEERALRLEGPLAKAMSLLERDLMGEVYAECKRLKLEDKRLSEIEEFMGLDEEHLLKMQYRKAKALGLQDRAKQKEIQIREMFFDAHEDMFVFTKFSRLRVPEEFASHTIIFWKREELAASMLVWSKNVVKTSLTNLDSSSAKIAINIHRAILGFCGDRNNPSPNSMAHEVLTKGLAKQGHDGDDIRDEIYCQLMKQLTQNPSLQSMSQAWQLLALCMSFFPPGRDLVSFVHVFIRVNVSDPERKTRLRDLLYNSEYAGVQPAPPPVDQIPALVASLGQVGGV